MKRFAILLSILFAVCVLQLTVNAADVPTISITDAKATHGDQVVLSLTIRNNPGIAAVVGTVTYDDENLKLIEIAKPNAVGGVLVADPESGNGFAWASGTDFTGDGVFALLTFEVKEKARENAYEIGFSHAPMNVCNAKEEAVAFHIEQGELTVICNHQFGGYIKYSNTEHMHICTICGKKETADHGFDAGVVTLYPTCTVAGVKTYTCHDCGATEERSIAPSHQPLPWKVTVQPTCTEGGKEEVLCLVCSESLDAHELAPLGHDDGVWQIVVGPTCTESGMRSRNCTVCSIVLEGAVMEATGHTFDDWQEERAPTLFADGSMSRVCACGEREEKTIPRVKLYESPIFAAVVAVAVGSVSLVLIFKKRKTSDSRKADQKRSIHSERR